MKSRRIRLVLLVTALVLAAAVMVQAFAAPPVEHKPHHSDKPHKPEHHEHADPGHKPHVYPWWPIIPPTPKPRTVTRQAETVRESTDAKGEGITLKNKVNVRSLPSVYATRVACLRTAGTLVDVTAVVINTAGAQWYAVTLQSGTLGYIRSDLLRVELDKTAASESAPQIVYVTSEPEVTPEIIYVTPAPAAVPTPTPIIVYVTPEPGMGSALVPDTEPTPQTIYIYQDEENG